MNKKLIAVAIAAAFAAPSAFAAAHGGSTTTLYGKAHVSINNGSDQWNVSSHASRIGVKGSESLSNGLKAIFQYEMTYNGLDGDGQGPLGGGTAIGAARNSYVGLSGDFGTFLVGRHDTPAKVAFYAAGNERLGDSIIDLNGSMGFAEFRVSNAIAYVSPSMSGFKAAVAIVPDENGEDVPTTLNGEDGLASHKSIGLMYAGNGIKAGLGYNDFADGSDLLNLGASMGFGNFNVGAQYQNIDGGDTEATIWALTGTATFGNNQIIAMYGNSDLEIGSESADVNTVNLAVKHSMSKRTSVYAAYTDGDDILVDDTGSVTTVDSVSADSVFAIGMIHTF